MPGRKRSRRTTSRRLRFRQNGRGIMSVIAKAAKIGYKLGRDKGYKRMVPGSNACKSRVGFSFITGYRTPLIWRNGLEKLEGGVLALDDLMEEGVQDKRVLDLFTKDSHHQNITVLYLTQDLFPPGKFSRTINRNAHCGLQKLSWSNGHTDHFSPSLSTLLASSLAAI